MENNSIQNKSRVKEYTLFLFMSLLSVVFLLPILIVAMNSFKGKLYISDNPFALPNGTTFSGIENYLSGIELVGFFQAFGLSLFVTVFSVLVIVLFTSMTAWYIVRVKSKFTRMLYYLFVFAMVVPFQMVMFTMVKMANMTHIDNPIGIVIIYLGFGAGQAVFIFSGFVKSIPLEIEEAAVIDGCNPFQTFFKVVIPIMKPVAITVAILNVMWIWNDYLLPYLVLGTQEFKTIPVAVQYLNGAYGASNMGAMMALLVLAVLPVIIFYVLCQKYIIEGIVAGAVKG